MKLYRRLFAAALGVSLSTAIASANSITVSESSFGDAGSGSSFSYDLSFINSTLNNGDFVTINDFGVGSPVSLPAGWAFSQSLSGPNSLPASDNPAILNATLTWVGGNGTVISPDPSTIVNQLITLTSPLPFGDLRAGEYTTIDHVSSGLVAGTDSRVIGHVRTPAAGPSDVPDSGSSLALIGFAFTAIHCARRKLTA